MSDNRSESFPEIRLYQLKPPELKGIDWDDDKLFFTYTFEEETSQFDPNGRWVHGGEYYERSYWCRVPIAFQNCEEMIDAFVMMMRDNYPDTKGFWVDAKNCTV
jgi:hypothetical protein